MNTKQSYLHLLDIIAGLLDNKTNRSMPELIVIKNYLKKRFNKNLHIRSKYSIISSIIINDNQAFITCKKTDYRGISKIVGFSCNIWPEE